MSTDWNGLALTLVNLPFDVVHQSLVSSAAKVNEHWQREHFLVEPWLDAPPVLAPFPLDELGPFHGFAYALPGGNRVAVVASTAQLMRVYEEGLGEIEGCVLDKIHWHARENPGDELRAYERIEGGVRTRFARVDRGRRSFQVLANGTPTDVEPADMLDPKRKAGQASRADLMTIAARLGMPIDDVKSWTPTSMVLRLGEGSLCAPADVIPIERALPVEQWKPAAQDSPKDVAELLELDKVKLDPPAHVAQWLSPVPTDGDRLTWCAACPCGSRSLQLSGYSGPEHSSTLQALCTECGETCTIHDGDVHGYDARAVLTNQPARPKGPLSPIVCSACDSISLHLTVRYQIELDEDMVEAADEHSLGLLDLYHWIFADAKCTGCQRTQEVLDEECA